uniref:Brix domain-containing protein n=1 Tax=Lankesteria abbotti TaxID=340204 RepID=A0A7S2QSF4_9APIC|mmetsp:Transcript_85/g.70  ORF Transcript_85/g.70 Transcript_85/m.70 type:complete len:103 (+) Transcript_85:163-471(+)
MLTGVTLQNMFPSIDARSADLSECRRVVLFNCCADTNLIEMRQYALARRSAGHVSAAIEHILSRSHQMDFGECTDVADAVLGDARSGGASPRANNTKQHGSV